ncbi:enoyl-CoA hydratase/isomerase family protein [Phytohabitans kaempferiae]|uniref:Enoyl-CoA hydratase/isomerase family protein n=1 Tax=Phytohabitans kaempferiae TaxID=1620943 RepID=A0ABV6LYG1_9ACTN
MIRVETPRPHVALVTLDKPARRNALDLPGFRALSRAWRDVAADGARVAVVTGVRDFSSGADLKTFPDDVAAALRGGELPEHLWGDIHGAILRDRVLPFPVVAAIEGICFGAGFELVGATDIRIAGDTAQFSTPEVGRGFMASGGTVARLPRQIGYAAAMQVLLTGARFGAERMREWGYVSEVVPAGTALDRALDIAELIAAHPPAAVRAIKRAVGEGVRGTLAEAYAIETRAADELL